MKALLLVLVSLLLIGIPSRAQEAEVPPVPVVPPASIDGTAAENAGSEGAVAAAAAEEEVEKGPEAPVVKATAAVEPEAGTDATEQEGDSSPYDMVLKDGRVLKNYQIQSWTKTMLTIFHTTGAANVPAHLLPENVVKAYSMDPLLSAEEAKSSRVKQTAQAEARLQAQDDRRALRKMPSVTIEGRVTSVGDDGVVLEVVEPKEIAARGYQRIGGMILDKNGQPVPKYRGQIFGSVWVTDHPLQSVVVDGDQLRFQGRVSGRQKVETKTYPSVRYEKAAR